METIKNYVVIDERYNRMDDDNFKAIPDQYKTLNIYMTYARADEAMHTMRGATSNYSVDDTLCVITDTVDGFMGDVKGKDRMLIIKWMFERFEDGFILDVETGEWSRFDEEEEDS